MVNLANLLAVMPNGLWEKLIFIFNNAFINFGLTVIMLTLAIKVLMLPLDFFNRYLTQKQMKQQEELAPEIEKIKKRCRNDKQKENQEMQRLYKDKHVNPLGSCLFMIINLALTLTIFITLLNGLNAMASFKIQDQYEQLQIVYVAEYVETEYQIDIYEKVAEINEIIANNTEISEADKRIMIHQLVLPYIQQMNSVENQEKGYIERANQRVAEKYAQVKDNFLWIDNIWLADTPFSSSIPSFESYAGVARITKEQIDNEALALKVTYNQIMDPLRESSGRANGFFVLTLLTGGTAFLNQWLMTRKRKNKQQTMAQNKNQPVQPQPGTGKFMLIFMPVFMAIFSLMYTSMFSIYLVASQLLSIASTPLINLIIDKIEKRKQNKKNKDVPKNPRRV